MHGLQRTLRNIIARCLVAAFPLGTCVIVTWLKHSMHWSRTLTDKGRTRRWSSGHTTRMLVMHAQHLWVARVNSTSANLYASDMVAKQCWLVLAHIRVPSRQHRIGMHPLSVNAFVQRFQVVTK